MNSERNPLASVVIPTFNRAEYLRQTLFSIEAQDYRPIQVIVIDDGSTDHTAEVVQSFTRSDLEIIYRKTPPSGGPSTPRNIGMSLAEGECVFLFDSDDIMLPGKIRETINAYETGKHYDIGLYFTNFVKVDSHSNTNSDPVLSSYYDFNRATKIARGSKLYEISSGVAYTTLCIENFIGTSSVMIPRDILNRHQLRFDTLLRNSEDRELWFKVALAQPIGYVDIIGHGYRKHSSAITTNDTYDTVANRIKVLERQLTQPLTSEQRQHLQKRIVENLMSQGYLHEKDEKYKAARLVYKNIFLTYGNIHALRRLVATFIKQILPAGRPERVNCEIKRTQPP